MLLSRRFVGMVTLLAALLFQAEQGWADTWQHTATSRISVEYETNPAMTPTNRGGMWRTLLEPGYTLTRTDGANEWRAGMNLQVARSSNTALSLNREDPSISLNWLRPNETGDLGLSARYEEAATRTTEAGATRVTAGDGTRYTRTLSANWNKTLNGRSTLAANGSYSNASYKGGTYVGYDARSAGLRITHDWSESVAPFLSLSYTDQKQSRRGALSRRTSATLGLSLKISERLDCSAQMDKSREGSGSGSSQYMTTARYADPRDNLALNAGRQVSNSGLGSFITSDQVGTDWSRELGERSRAGINLSWRKNRSITDESNRTLDIWLQHDLDASWAARTHYQRRTREFGKLNTSSNLVGLSLVYTRSNF